MNTFFASFSQRFQKLLPLNSIFQDLSVAQKVVDFVVFFTIFLIIIRLCSLTFHLNRLKEMNTNSKTRFFNSKKTSYVSIINLVRGKKKTKCSNRKSSMIFLLVERNGNIV